jgi:hypothetical protein
MNTFKELIMQDVVSHLPVRLFIKKSYTQTDKYQQNACYHKRQPDHHDGISFFQIRYHKN